MRLLRRLFARKPDPVRHAARRMQREGVEHQRALVRARVDAMREKLGMEPAQWPEQ